MEGKVKEKSLLIKFDFKYAPQRIFDQRPQINLIEIFLLQKISDLKSTAYVKKDYNKLN